MKINIEVLFKLNVVEKLSDNYDWKSGFLNYIILAGFLYRTFNNKQS